MSVQTKRLTAEEFWQLYSSQPEEVVNGMRPNYELVDGERVMKNCPKLLIEMRLSRLHLTWLSRSFHQATPPLR